VAAGTDRNSTTPSAQGRGCIGCLETRQTFPIFKNLLQIMEKVRDAGTGFRSITEAVDTTTSAGRMLMQNARELRRVRAVDGSRTDSRWLGGRSRSRSSAWLARQIKRSSATRSDKSSSRRIQDSGRRRAAFRAASLKHRAFAGTLRMNADCNQPKRSSTGA
jgi:hypothetical protein